MKETKISAVLKNQTQIFLQDGPQLPLVIFLIFGYSTAIRINFIPFFRLVI